MGVPDLVDSYTLDATGQRLGMSELNGRSTTWAYDTLNRLTSETISRNNTVEHTESYTLDTVGNRTAVTTNGITTNYTYNANDQVLTAGNVAYSYDNNGNRLGEVDALTGDFKTYQYNAKNRLVAANTLSDTLGFSYDINGIRTAKTVNGQTTTYMVDHNRDYAQVLVEETAGVKTLYTYGNDLVSQQAANDSRYYLYDGLGSTRALTDQNGTVTDSYEYSAYGSELNQSGTTANAYRYTGEQLDEETGLYYLRARYLDPVTGFTQLDTYQGRMQEPVTLHKYLYANGNPVMFTDPSGMYSLSELMTTINTASTLYDYAITAYDMFGGSLDEDRIQLFDEGVDIWSTLMANALSNLSSAFVPETLALIATPYALSGATEGHHTIPVYVCGHMEQKTSQLTRKDHRKLHNDLYAFSEAVNLAGRSIDLLFKRPKSRFIKTPIQRLGRFRKGRAAIAQSLFVFYEREGWLGQGVPSVGIALTLEARRFIAGHSSYPRCRR